MKRTFPLLLLFYLLIMSLHFSSCHTDPYEKDIREYAKDGIISEEEKSKIESKSKLFAPVLNQDGNFDTTAFNEVLNQFRISKVAYQFNEVVYNPPTYKVFLENSGSMDGFVKGKTRFETAIYSFLSDLKIESNHIAKALNLYYINSEKKPFPPDVEDFIDKLEPSTFKERGGSRSDSDIKNIIESVLSEVDDTTVCVFISDCLFSLSRKGDLQDYLMNQNVGIKNIFAKKVNQLNDLSIMVIQLSSNFDGTFYTHQNAKIRLNDEPRPYYVWLMGSKKYLQDLTAKLDLNKSMKGYILNYYSWSKDATFTPQYRTTAYQSIGSFTPDKNEPLTKMTNVKTGSRGEEAGIFQFSVAVNFEAIGLDTNYILDPSNYFLESDVPYYSIKEVVTLDKMTQRKVQYLKDYTHLIKIRSEKPLASKIEIGLKQKVPKWVNDWHWEPENGKPNNDLEKKKSFGLKYLIEGLNDAYTGNTKDQNAFFTLNISIE